MTLQDDDSLDDWESDDDSADIEVESPCPNCKMLIHLDAVRCPRCGHYITDFDDDRRISSVPRWITITTIILLAAFLLSIIFLRW